MSGGAQFFLLVLAPAFAIVLALLGLETLDDTLLGWALLAVGVSYPAGAITSYSLRRVPFGQAAGSVIHEEQGDRSFWVILPGMLGVFFAPPLEFLYLGALLPLSLGMQVAGVTLVILGGGLGIWSRGALGGIYSGHVQVTTGQVLVTSGPYRFIRHPAYAGVVLAALGVAIGYGSILGLAAIGLLLFPALAYRIRVEENLLERRFGDPYRLYQHRVRTLIPGIW
jgi:protein-S-isoprenylcysteine O-methyltransferase Ste14